MNKENCALKLVDEIILYYDARSKKHQITFFIVHPTNHLYTYFRNLWKFRTLHTNILQYLDHTLPDADTSILTKLKSSYLVAVHTTRNKANKQNKFFIHTNLTVSIIF